MFLVKSGWPAFLTSVIKFALCVYAGDNRVLAVGDCLAVLVSRQTRCSSATIGGVAHESRWEAIDRVQYGRIGRHLLWLHRAPYVFVATINCVSRAYSRSYCCCPDKLMRSWPTRPTSRSSRNSNYLAQRCQLLHAKLYHILLYAKQTAQRFQISKSTTLFLMRHYVHCAIASWVLRKNITPIPAFRWGAGSTEYQRVAFVKVRFLWDKHLENKLWKKWSNVANHEKSCKQLFVNYVSPRGQNLLLRLEQRVPALCRGKDGEYGRLCCSCQFWAAQSDCRWLECVRSVIAFRNEPWCLRHNLHVKTVARAHTGYFLRCRAPFAYVMTRTCNTQIQVLKIHCNVQSHVRARCKHWYSCVRVHGMTTSYCSNTHHQHCLTKLFAGMESIMETNMGEQALKFVTNTTCRSM